MFIQIFFATILFSTLAVVLRRVNNISARFVFN